MSFHPRTRNARARHVCALVAATCLASLLYGCGNSEMAAVPSTHRADGGSLELLSAPASPGPAAVTDGVVSMDVPVDVILVGFPRDSASQLASTLAPAVISQMPNNYPRLNGSQPFNPGLFKSRAIFQVRYAPQALADGYRNALQPGVDGEHPDGNAAERWLQQALADAGFTADPARPAVVLLHRGASGPGYSYEYGNGTHAPVRVIGSGDLLIMDLSAEADPFVGSTATSYSTPVALDDPDLVDKLASAASDATHYRLLQGPIYVPSMKSCHALTVLAAKRVTATDGWPGLPLDAEQLRSTFGALTGDEVFVDVKELTLPQDDPELDLFTRILNDAPSAGVDPDNLAREWVESHWSTYHVAHEGCEEYLTLVVSGDATDVQGRGTAEYDAGNGHRFAYTMATSLCPLIQALPLPVRVGNCLSRDGIRDYRLPNELVTHETGHLFGLRHPHDITDASGNSFANYSFSSLATSMSYELDDRMLGFGAIDENNHQRNRAASALWMADLAGLNGSSAFASALQAMQQYRWNDVTNLLRNLDLSPREQRPSSAFCTFMPAGTVVESVMDPDCPGCTASDESLAVDGSYDTFATLSPSGLTGGGTLRATAPTGTIFAAGTTAGAYITRPDMLQFEIRVRTYLAGELQEDQGVLSGDLGTAGPHGFYGATTSKAFDAVEFVLHMTGTGRVEVEEFCSDGHGQQGEK